MVRKCIIHQANLELSVNIVDHGHKIFKLTRWSVYLPPIVL